jgi:hypothetical protein
MGWCSGTVIGENIYNLIRNYIPPDKRKRISKRIINILNEHDADAWELEDQLMIDSGETEEIMKENIEEENKQCDFCKAPISKININPPDYTVKYKCGHIIKGEEYNYEETKTLEICKEVK